MLGCPAILRVGAILYMGGFHQVMNALMALLIGVEYATGMENLVTLLVVALVFYFGLVSAAKKLQADHHLRDFGAFINKISIFFGILSLIIEVLIIVLAHGSVPVFLWSICIVSVAVAGLVLVRLAFFELNEKLRKFWKWFYDGCTAALKSALERRMSMTKHEAQDQNQNRTPV